MRRVSGLGVLSGLLAASLGACTASHLEAVDAAVDAVTPATTPHVEGAHTCAVDRDCPSAWPICRCDGRCWAVDAETGIVRHGPAPRTLAYVFGGLRIPSDARGSEAYGLDLDGLRGPLGSCSSAPDSVSPVTRDDDIDNQIQGLLRTGETRLGSTMGDASFDAVLDGPNAWAIEVSDIDSFVDDCHVDVTLLLAQSWTPLVLGANCNYPDASSCTADTQNACVWSNAMRACRGLAAGQSMRVYVVVGQGVGRIAGGILRTEALGQMQLVVRFREPGSAAAMQLHEARVFGRITPEALSGELGAYVEMDNLQVFADSLTIGSGMPRIDAASTAPPDLALSPGGRCTVASAGFAFAAQALELTR